MIEPIGASLERRLTKIRDQQAAQARSAVVLHPAALPNPTGCPEIDAARQRDLAQWREERRRQQQSALDKRCQSAGIPARHRNCTLDNYQAESDGQRKALEVCRRFAGRFAQVSETGGNLLLLGQPGTGKTHLACAILREVTARGAAAVFTTEAGLLASLRATYQPGADASERDALDAFREPALLVIDECGVGIGNPETRRAMLYSVINPRYEALKPSLVVSNLTPAEMRRHIGPRAWDRLTDQDSAMVSFNWRSRRQGHRA